MKSKIVVVLGILILLGSCGISIEKRRYNKGFHIQTNTKKRSANTSSQKENLTKDRQNKSVSNDKSVAQTTTVATEQNTSLISTDINEVVENESNNTVEQSISANNVVTEQELYQQQNLVEENGSETKNELSKSEDSSNMDYYLYGLSALMALSAFGLIRSKKVNLFRVTKWANKNKRSSKVLITLNHVVIGGLGLALGNELYQGGVEISTTSQYVFSSVALLSAGYLLVNEKKNKISIWGSYFKNKFAHVLIGASLFATFTGIGNTVNSDVAQVTPVGHLASYVTSDNDHKKVQITDTKLDLKEVEPGSKSKGSGGMIALFIILGILALAVTAVAACAVGCSGSAIGAIAVGVLGTGLAVWLFYLASRYTAKGMAKKKAKAEGA